jgi:hypothetical protein
MWTYIQKTGVLLHEGECVAVGYAGNGAGKNNPHMDYVKGIGPLPVGHYHIGDPQDTATHGPCVLRLTPYALNIMYGRDGFLIHGDSVKAPGTASHGCIILPRVIRELIGHSADRVLLVKAKA